MTSPSSDPVAYARAGDVGILTMQFGPHNLVGGTLSQALIAALQRAQADSCRAIILKSALRHFSAGAEIALFENGGERLHRELDLVGVLRAFEELPIPIVASVHGVALGGGFELALACDFIVAAATAKLGLVEATLGLHPLMGGIQRLIERAGTARAKELVMLGRRHDAATLERWNIVNRVVPDAQLAEVTLAFATELAAGPTVRMRLPKAREPISERRDARRGRWDAGHRCAHPCQCGSEAWRGGVSGGCLGRRRVHWSITGQAMANGPLAGLKVVDFSRVLAGPHCAKTLHDLGAEVIKIEPPRPDISRAAVPRNDTMSYYYIQQNTGKRNISLDLNHPEARDIAMDLCRQADIIVENFRAGTLAFFGLDYESVRKQNSRVVYASISGYGQGGPLSHRAAYAPTVHAESGFTSTFLSHLAGDLATDRHDAYSHADIYTGLEAVIGILAALHKRSLTNEGQYVDVAMAATMLSVNERVHIDLSGIDIGAEPAALGPAQSPFLRPLAARRSPSPPAW